MIILYSTKYHEIILRLSTDDHHLIRDKKRQLDDCEITLL